MVPQHLNEFEHTHSFGLEHAKKAEKYTLIVIGITAITMVIEVTTGIIFGSMALLADGVHMGSHALALVIAAFSYFYTRKNATDKRFSFGTGKVNALGGYTSAVLLVAFAISMVRFWFHGGLGAFLRTPAPFFLIAKPQSNSNATLKIHSKKTATKSAICTYGRLEKDCMRSIFQSSPILLEHRSTTSNCLTALRQLSI